MINIIIHRAQPLNGHEHDDLCIQTFHPFPKVDMAHARDLFQTDANALCTAICSVLPTGTIDELLIALLRRKASDLVVNK